MWANWVIRWHLSLPSRVLLLSKHGDVTLRLDSCVWSWSFPIANMLAYSLALRCFFFFFLRVRSQRPGLVICALCFSCKEMRCHENKNLAMLACAACAREKQHLLGQLLKETEINGWEGGRAKRWLWTCLVRMGFRSPIPLTHTHWYPKVTQGRELLW